MTTQELRRGACVKVLHLTRRADSLGGIFLREEHLAARKTGTVGIIVGFNPLVDNVCFVLSVENGAQTTGVYGVDELEVVDGSDLGTKTDVYVAMRRARMLGDDP